MPKGSTFISAGLALCFSCFGQSELAKNTLASPQPTPGRNSLSHVQLIEGFNAVAKPRQITLALTAPTKPRKPIYLVSQASRALTGGRCAHIILKLAPPDIDTKLVLKPPEDRIGSIPVFRGLPQCLEDVR